MSALSSTGVLLFDSHCRLAVLALEVGGRFSPETADFAQRLARARARSVSPRARVAPFLAAFARRLLADGGQPSAGRSHVPYT